MDKKSIEMESGPHHRNQSKQSGGKTEKRWEDDINEFFKPEEMEGTKGNDLQNNDIWIWAAIDQKRWKNTENEYVRR